MEVLARLPLRSSVNLLHMAAAAACPKLSFETLDPPARPPRKKQKVHQLGPGKEGGLRSELRDRGGGRALLE